MQKRMQLVHINMYSLQYRGHLNAICITMKSHGVIRSGRRERKTQENEGLCAVYLRNEPFFPASNPLVELLKFCTHCITNFRSREKEGSELREQMENVEQQALSIAVLRRN